jgi:regulator of replication initiation timing
LPRDVATNTVYKNSIEKYIMDIDFADDWLGSPTDEQMLRQHAHLVTEENLLLRIEVNRYRNHVARLVDMHAQVTKERDGLRKELADANGRISDLLRTACENWKRVNSLQYCLEQREALLMQHNVPPKMWGKGGTPDAHLDSES